MNRRQAETESLVAFESRLKQAASMNALEVYLNGKRICIAGLEGFGGVSAIAWTRRRRESESESESEPADDDLTLSVSGYDATSKEFLKWLPEREIALGDEIRIRAVEAAKPDEPVSRHQDDPDQRRRDKEKYVRQYAKELGWLIVTETDSADQTATSNGNTD